MKAKTAVALVVVVAVLALTAFYLTRPRPAGRATLEDLIKEAKVKFELRSEAFDYGGRIPAKYTCDGEDVPPPLSWSGQPKGTVSYVLICYDPDAPRGTFIHWVLFNIPGDVTELRGEEVGVKGVNDFGRLGYGGPCPPRGSAHRYFFVLLALDTKLNLKEGATLQDVLNAAKGHVLGYAETMGKYGRG